MSLPAPLGLNFYMGTPREPIPVKLFVALLCTHESLFSVVEEELALGFGAIDGSSKALPWDVTAFYRADMGPGLVRRFVSHTSLILPDRIAAIKRKTQELEERHRWSREGRTGRQVNIDPGYLEAGKVVLASTKNAGHRIYLGSGVYGELTLAYQEGRFKPYPTTYPDYRWPETLEFLTRVRSVYLKQLKEERKNGY